MKKKQTQRFNIFVPLEYLKIYQELQDAAKRVGLGVGAYCCQMFKTGKKPVKKCH